MAKIRKVPVLKHVAGSVARHVANSKAKKIAEHFAIFLEPIVAFEPNDKSEVFKIRHNVYCTELGFEEERPDQQEKDLFDDYSIHCLIQHKSSKKYAGTIRLITPKKEEEVLPIEKYCLNAISDDEVHPNDFPKETVAEISRLAVPLEFRKRNADKFDGASTGAINEQTYSEDELRCFPFIAVGLYMSVANIAFHEKIEHVFVMMEPRLARSLAFVGIQFKKIGPTVEYHGKRAPYYISRQMLIDSLPAGFIRLMNNISGNIDRQFAAREALENEKSSTSDNKPLDKTNLTLAS
ncbi:PEP-CTERM/exosortase system-associated acyltransferase [Catenovulum sp. SM1970]|nr:PEP-CTERM/exosortase system-associated acyltransferase [Marinifaba aquimaris]